MTNLAISDETFARLSRAANTQNISTEALAEQALRRFLHETERQKMQRETDAFRAQHADLFAKYAGQYVAMHEGQVVDHDADQLTLVMRIDEQYPDTPVLITQVARDPIEVYHIS